MINSSKLLYRAIGKSMVGRYTVYGANLLSMMLLARIFTPEVFGLVASVMVFYIFFQLLAEAGLGPAIINLKEIRKEDRNGLFGLTIVVGGLLAVMFFIMSPVFFYFYKEPCIYKAVPYIAVSLFFFSASIVPNSLLLREQHFFNIAKAGLIAEICSTSASIFLAYFISPIDALAAKAVSNAFFSFASLYVLSSRTEVGRPLLGKKFSAILPVLGFSGYQVGFNFINYFSRNLDKILVGKYIGSSSLGVYDKAYQLMRYPLLLLTFAMTPAIQPVLRQFSENKTKVKKIHDEFTFKLSLLGSIAGFLVYCLANVIVYIALGDQWEAVVPIIQVLAVAIPVQVVLSTSGSFFQAMGRADLLFVSGIFSAIVMVGFISMGVATGELSYLSWGLVVAFHINFIITYTFMYKILFKESMSLFFLKMVPACLVVVLICILHFLKVNMFVNIW